MERFELTSGVEIAAAGFAAQDLELAVAYTTPDLTSLALRQAERLAMGLNAHVRLLRVLVVPYPLDMSCSPVSLTFFEEQIAKMHCSLPITAEVYLAREPVPAFLAALKPEAVMIVGSKSRPWRTPSEKLAAHLRRAGREVVVCYPEAELA